MEFGEALSKRPAPEHCLLNSTTAVPLITPGHGQRLLTQTRSLIRACIFLWMSRRLAAAISLASRLITRKPAMSTCHAMRFRDSEAVLEAQVISGSLQTLHT